MVILSHAFSIFFFNITEHLPLCQAGCRGDPAARGQRHNREGEERHGSGQVRHMRCVKDSWIKQLINNHLKSYINLLAWDRPIPIQVRGHNYFLSQSNVFTHCLLCHIVYFFCTSLFCCELFTCSINILKDTRKHAEKKKKTRQWNRNDQNTKTYGNFFESTLVLFYLSSDVFYHCSVINTVHLTRLLCNCASNGFRWCLIFFIV